MSNPFYVGQPDYIAQLNALYNKIGTAGPPGAKAIIYAASGDPNAQSPEFGDVGDYYIRNDNGTFWEKEAVGSPPVTEWVQIGDFAGGGISDVTATLPAVSTPSGSVRDISVNVFVASGASHKTGLVPDPGVSAGITKFLREDATWQTPGGGVVAWLSKNSAYNAVSGDHIMVDTSGGAVTVTLPATPGTGDWVSFADAASSWATNNLTVGRNGKTIVNSATDFIANISDSPFSLAYTGTTWILTDY